MRVGRYTPQGAPSTAPTPSTRPHFPTSSSKPVSNVSNTKKPEPAASGSGSSMSTARNRDMACHTCGGKGHFKRDCPNRKVMIINEDNEYETGDDADPYAPEDDEYDTDGVDAYLSEARTIVVSHALNEFSDVFPEEVPAGLPPLRGIEHQIDLIHGAHRPIGHHDAVAFGHLHLKTKCSPAYRRRYTMVKESPKWTNNTKPRHICKGADIDKDQERRNSHGARKKEGEEGKKRRRKREEEAQSASSSSQLPTNHHAAADSHHRAAASRQGLCATTCSRHDAPGRAQTDSASLSLPLSAPSTRRLARKPPPTSPRATSPRPAWPRSRLSIPCQLHAPPTQARRLILPPSTPASSSPARSGYAASLPPRAHQPTQSLAHTEEYTEHLEEDTSSSTADVEEHVELYTDYGSASIANMTDIEELYTDHGSASIANMDDIDELYIDTCSTSMDDMVEHHDEDDIDPTMHTADAPTYPYLANGATYEDRGPPRWHHHIIDITDIIWSIKSAPNMSHHLGMARTVIDSHHLMIVVGHHHLMVYIDIRPHMIFDDTTQDMVMRQEDESLDMKTFLIRRLLPLVPPPQWPLPRHMPMDSDATSASNKATFHGNVPISYVSAKKLYFDELNAQVSKMPPLEDDLGGEGVEHGILPSPKEAHGVEHGEHGILPSPTEAHGVEMVEHGKFPSTTKEAHGDEQVEPTPICLIDELVPIPCEHESHLAHLSESDSELSDFHPICEFECFHLEDMSDTQSSTEDEFPLMEKMYMVHEDDDISPCLLQDGHVDHMDPPTSTTPTSHESAYKGADIDKDQERRNSHGARKKEGEEGKKRRRKREEEAQSGWRPVNRTHDRTIRSRTRSDRPPTGSDGITHQAA
ncbi:hypothetical protein QYE76_032097 [Lolium multiflorum]|uniref:CCHC-type domain-containing protein n=1 Tax=Lolium multiflorum TaxID=4521 RepID=A0AAD8QUT9_LOLMU|nr:hypothetical protein QYE76_032097 [Lolium multiflorum]